MLEDQDPRIHNAAVIEHTAWQVMCHELERIGAVTSDELDMARTWVSRTSPVMDAIREWGQAEVFKQYTIDRVMAEQQSEIRDNPRAKEVKE